MDDVMAPWWSLMRGYSTAPVGSGWPGTAWRLLWIIRGYVSFAFSVARPLTQARSSQPPVSVFPALTPLLGPDCLSNPPVLGPELVQDWGFPQPGWQPAVT